MRKRHRDPGSRKAKHERREVERAARLLERKQQQPPANLPNHFVLEYGAEILANCGPQFYCNWGVPKSVAGALENAGRTVPSPIVGALLLDTGATRTCIALQAAIDLGLQATRMQDGFGAAGAHRNPVFLARLEIVIEHPKTHDRQSYAWEQEVEGIPELHKFAAPLVLNGRTVPVSGLLGRDILRHARINYDGPAGKLRFEFDLKSLQQDPSR